MEGNVHHLRQRRRPYTPSTTEGIQPREHTVPCQLCAGQTWNPSAVCDHCKRTLVPQLEADLLSEEMEEDAEDDV